ncbi:MAG: phospholipase D family protein [Dehalococcoidia bacterium]|nr:phospholipase D family protein [Dehalococcoidia bacterium]
MARFYGTNGVSHCLDEIIKGATERILLISSYLKFSRRIQEELKRQDMLRRDIRIVYGKTDLRPEESEWLAGTDIRTSFRENLHAKCYMNESQALITSMNLYEFSQQHNDEMGILVSTEDDLELYNAIRVDAERILQLSERTVIDIARVAEEDKKPARTRRSSGGGTSRRNRGGASSRSGHCIRCKRKIPFDVKKPYCSTDFQSWARYENRSYTEKYCLLCGDSHDSSMAKPLCSRCYRRVAA